MKNHRIGAAIGLGSVYAGFALWSYFAWYRGHPGRGFKFGGDGWLGSETYAGGADKFGHAWATMGLARGGTAILDAGGWNHTQATIVGAVLSEALFFAVEVKDGYYYEFSPSDLTGDTLGALAAVALELSPRLDELFDFRVQYFPSDIYLRKVDGSSPCLQGHCSRWNIAEDYSGETYLLALHLGAIHQLRDMKYGSWSQFVDVAIGFDSRNYKPPPDDPTMSIPRQQLFLGVSLNAQGLCDWLFRGRSEPARKITHGLFEVLNLPFTSLPVVDTTRVATHPPDMGGA
ncbi:MAG: hypothetical protein JWO36_3140 [Myxococcales bacterium]|nr:hypothetical protein [Myxococcales bacterium]